MSTITAPASPSAPYYIGKGYRDDNGTEVMIFGHPLPNDGNLGVSSLVSPISMINPTTLFDLSSLTQNHEVVALLYQTNQEFSSSVNTVVTWYRKRDNAVVFQLNKTLSVPDGTTYGGMFMTAWIGWLADNLNITNPEVTTYPTYKEIQENGDYYAIMQFTGGINTTSPSLNFAVSGMPAKTVLFKTGSGFSYTLRLSNYFDSSNYIKAGVCTSDFTDGQSDIPDGVLDTVFAPSSANGGCVAISSVSYTSNATIYGWVQASNGLYYKVGSPVFYGNLDITVEKRSYHSAKISWTANSSATSYNVNVLDPDYGTNGITYSTSNTFVNWDYNREKYSYPITVYAYNSSGVQIDSASTTYTSPDETIPSINIDDYSKTATSITLYVSGYDNSPPSGGSASGIAGYYYYIDYGSGWESAGTDINSGSTSSHTFYGLQNGTTYSVGVRSYDGDLNISTMDWMVIETVVVVPVFEWDTAKNPNEAFNVSASEWNRLTDTITLAREHQTNKTAISFTTAPYSDGRFYAFMFNQALVGIRGGQLEPNGFNYEPLDGIDLTNYSLPANVNSGDIIYAWYFNNLRGALNSAD
jgi:hypothetical protein